MKPVVDVVVLYSGITGRRIRKVTRVRLESGCVVTFMDRMPKKKAIEQAREVCSKRSASLGGRKWNGTRR